MASRPEVIEIAFTDSTGTSVESHLRYLTGGMTLCGKNTPRRPIREMGKDGWFPVSQDEANNFVQCDRCAARAASFHVVSRPLTSERPGPTQDHPGPSMDSAQAAEMGDLLAAICASATYKLADRSIVPHSILRDVDRLLTMISDATIGNGIAGGLSAIDARQRLDAIRGKASEIRHNLWPYMPASINRHEYTAEEAAARIREIKEAATASETAETAPNT